MKKITWRVLKRIGSMAAKSCWICGAPITSGTVCDDCNKGPE